MTWFLDFLMWLHFGDKHGPGFFQVLLMACVIFGSFFVVRSIRKRKSK